MNRLIPIFTLFLAGFVGLRAETMLQIFNLSYSQLIDKMPEIAEAGYTSLWLPPPCKGGGSLSVGYDLFDRFDLGSKDQRGGIATRYGTEGDLLEMIDVAHRFGIRVYFDNIMNHNGFEVPGYNESTPIDLYPGMVPEDFHLQVTEDGFYRSISGTRDWGSAWQVQNLNLAGLIDIAHENPNTNHGPNEGDDFPKISFIRHPDNPEYYLDLDLPLEVTTPDVVTYNVYPFANKEVFEDIGYGVGSTGAGNGVFDWDDVDGDGQHDAGETSEPFTDSGVDGSNPNRQTLVFGFGDGIYNMGNPVVEDVNAMLIRSVRWFMDRTKADGLRLDAVKHVPDYFFGQQFGSNKDWSGAGYLGGLQEQFNISRGFSDWNNHRDTVFSTENPRDDAMVFGEHLGQPPGYDGYINAGMRLIDNPLRDSFNNILGNPGASLFGFDNPGAGGFGAAIGVMHAQSHDSDYAARRELQHAFYFTREGLGLVYTDGNFQADLLPESGGAFPRHANTAFLGQFSDNRLPNLNYIHNHFARGYQAGRWADGDFVAYERIDKRENGGMSDTDGVTLLFMLNDNYASGQGRQFYTSFNPGAYLKNYSSYGGPFYITVGDNGSGGGQVSGSTIVPAGGYFAFSWRNPETPYFWPGNPITIYENGVQAGTVSVERADGPDGDPAFNPYGLPDADSTDYSYSINLPRVTDASNLRLVANFDGSAENVLFRLNGGMDINSHLGLGPQSGDLRDNPPAIATDVYLGYEQGAFIHRMYAEKFAAVDTLRCKYGSGGAGTYSTTIGSGVVSYSVDSGHANNDYDNLSGNAASWLYHQPDAPVGGSAPTGTTTQFRENGDGTISIWGKTNSVGDGFNMAVYYTTDGSYPEGGGGIGLGTTQVAMLGYSHGDAGDDWWGTATLPAPTNGTSFIYKIGIYKDNTSGSPLSSVFPASESLVNGNIVHMATQFEISGLNANTLAYHPHNDYSEMAVGLPDGFHQISARGMLDRSGRAAIYNTHQQTFYLDQQRPGGEITFPSGNGQDIGGNEYGFVVRGDRSIRDIWFLIEDSNINNDSVESGNGYWQQATNVTPTPSIETPYPWEWRFSYGNIPDLGTATIYVVLREWSSAEMESIHDGSDFLLNEAEGHYTLLTRNVNTRGPVRRLNVAFPSQDGQIVGDNYIMKAYFNKDLYPGASAQQLIDRFTIKIASSNSGSADSPVVQDPANYSIAFDETGDSHALAYDLPNLYNGEPDFIHTIIVEYDDPVLPDLTATRQIKAYPEVKPIANIITPPAFDNDGAPYVLVLPKKAPGDIDPTVDRATDFLVETSGDITSLNLSFTQGTGTLTLQNTQTIGISKQWAYRWTGITEGSFSFLAEGDDGSGGAPEVTATRTTLVSFREQVEADGSDFDDDDDGIHDDSELNLISLPETNSNTWTNGQVHTHLIYGRSLPQSPDSDGDLLPDGLELGWREPIDANTDTTTDTDGDGYPNFIGDRDPPFYATTDNENVPGFVFNGFRTELIAGSITDPNNPDTDGDGIIDGIEDANRNGWVDGDGAALDPAETNPVANRTVWPDRLLNPDDNWTETDPNNPDTDGDELSDGYGEDKNFDGKIAGDINGNRIWDNNEAWTETDPLKYDTDGDGLYDGWEIFFGLDPLDNGVDSYRIAGNGDGNPNYGASGNPDGDSFTNIQELSNGTHPTVFDDPNASPGAGSITIGEGTSIVYDQVTNRNEFTDWTNDDLLMLDEFEGEGFNNAGSDTYLAYDGFDPSRDITAFYFRDGGSSQADGDDRLYFRIDLYDLQPFAEEANLDAYIVIDFGNAAVGEANLPDEIDTITEMGWEAVVVSYSGGVGTVYIDQNPASNTTTVGADLSAFGVVSNSAAFVENYYNSELDALEIAIDRNALVAAGWSGDPNSLNFQVYTTRDGTGNAGPGLGDIGGRSDIRDSILDDHIAEETGQTVAVNGTLDEWYGLGTANTHQGQKAKVIFLVHGNQALQPASVTHNLINNGNGAGYFRAIDAHEAFNLPLTLHITPTLASAIQWAAADPALGKSWLDGPSLNARLRALVDSGGIELLGSTFADHILPYFPESFNTDNLSLASEFLTQMYGTHSSETLWLPERVADDAVLHEMAGLGYDFFFLDQSRHLIKWFGRNDAIGQNGYRVNRIELNGGRVAHILPINDGISNSRFKNMDKGLDDSFRSLLQSRARGDQNQFVVILSQWEDFQNNANADAYDLNLRWIANQGWIEVITAQDVIDRLGTEFFSVERGNQSGQLELVAKDFIDHGSQESYDNWYFGQNGLEEGLEPKIFDIRPGVPLPDKFGQAGVDGIADNAWSTVSALSFTADNVGALARATLHASMFETAFHNVQSSNLLKFSTGDYVYPDSDYNTLAGFAAQAQAQARRAGVYRAVDIWLAAVGLGTATNGVALADDLDFDGENEYLLYNNNLLGIIEAQGGRMIAAWLRDPGTGDVYQVLGNPVSYSASETENPGDFNVNSSGTLGAYTMAAFTDWSANPAGGATNQYVSDLYTPTLGSANITLSSSDGLISKNISIGTGDYAFTVNYTVDASLNTLYTRHGLSPDLYNLLLTGQNNLTDLTDTGTALEVAHQLADKSVKAYLEYGGTHNATPVPGAVDDLPGTVEFDSRNMRNLAHTQQVEVSGAGSFSFSLGFGIQGGNDADGDGLPTDWEDFYGLNAASDSGNDGADGNPDGDQTTNIQEYILDTDPTKHDNGLVFTVLQSPRGAMSFSFDFPTVAGRTYLVQYRNGLDAGSNWLNAQQSFIGDGNSYTYTDDGTGLTQTPPYTAGKRFYRLLVSAGQ